MRKLSMCRSIVHSTHKSGIQTETPHSPLHSYHAPLTGKSMYFKLTPEVMQIFLHVFTLQKLNNRIILNYSTSSAYENRCPCIKTFSYKDHGDRDVRIIFHRWQKKEGIRIDMGVQMELEKVKWNKKPPGCTYSKFVLIRPKYLPRRWI